VGPTTLTADSSLSFLSFPFLPRRLFFSYDSAATVEVYDTPAKSLPVERLIFLIFCPFSSNLRFDGFGLFPCGYAFRGFGTFLGRIVSRGNGAEFEIFVCVYAHLTLPFTRFGWPYTFWPRGVAPFAF